MSIESEITSVGQRRSRWRVGWKKAAVITTLTALAFGAGGGLFWAGWTLNSWGAAQVPMITTEGDIGFLTLISPAESDLLAINGITGEKIEFLPKSDMNMLDTDERYLFTSHEAGPQSGVTRIDLETGETDVIVSFRDHDFSNLDGLLWTPWNTLLVGEETAGGRLFEILNPLADEGDVQFVERTAFGTRRNEGLAIDSAGNVYGVDEVPDGGIYRFIPDAPFTVDSLAAGHLEVLVSDERVRNLDSGRVPARWEDAATSEPIGFGRPEDIEIVGDTLYVALTSTDEVISLDLSDPATTSIGLFVSADTNAPELTGPDNLASDPDGNIYIAENIALSRYKGQRNQLWFARAEDPLQPATELKLIATLNSPRNEFSGILVDSAGERLFTNVLGPDNYIYSLQITD